MLSLLQDPRRLPGVPAGPFAGGCGLVGVAYQVHLASPLRHKLACFAAQSQAQPASTADRQLDISGQSTRIGMAANGGREPGGHITGSSATADRYREWSAP